MNTVYNFSAGPAVPPAAGIRNRPTTKAAVTRTGIPVMSMSHRSAEFQSILYHAEQDLRLLLNVPDYYKILFLQGGASAQFSQAAMNFSHGFKRIDSVVTGNWSQTAYRQMEKSTAAEIHLAAHGGTQYDYCDLPPVSEWDISRDSAFVHFVANETVHGLQYRRMPKLSDGLPPLICDMSSEILSRPIDVADFGVIYAGAQKNLGPAGVTIVVARRELLAKSPKNIPTMLRYAIHLDKNSLYNTPPAFCIYMVGKTVAWIKAQGGLAAMAERNAKKAALLYNAIDDSEGFYRGHAAKDSRSFMNVTFRLPTEELEKKFVDEAKKEQLYGVKGHRSVGGMRASIYNAMPYEGVQKLADFMKQFRIANA